MLDRRARSQENRTSAGTQASLPQTILESVRARAPPRTSVSPDRAQNPLSISHSDRIGTKRWHRITRTCSCLILLHSITLITKFLLLFKRCFSNCLARLASGRLRNLDRDRRVGPSLHRSGSHLEVKSNSCWTDRL